MNIDFEQLTPLLRVELTAVHQQFTHMLALRQWKNNKDLLKRITKVDSEDFSNAMQIIDLLVSRGIPIKLPSHEIRPGSDLASILKSELRMEERFAEVLDATEVVGPEALARVQRASAPRQSYRQWLSEQLDRKTPADFYQETNTALAKLLSDLMALVEQAMLHAFLHWYTSERNRADNAWRLSGAAMLYATALIRRGADLKAVPIPAPIPSVQMAKNAPDAFAADIELVGRCAEYARLAAKEENDDETRQICRQVGDDCDLIVGMGIDEDFPAVYGRSPVFESFAATRERYV